MHHRSVTYIKERNYERALATGAEVYGNVIRHENDVVWFKRHVEGQIQYTLLRFRPSAEMKTVQWVFQTPDPEHAIFSIGSGADCLGMTEIGKRYAGLPSAEICWYTLSTDTQFVIAAGTNLPELKPD